MSHLTKQEQDWVAENVDKDDLSTFNCSDCEKDWPTFTQCKNTGKCIGCSDNYEAKTNVAKILGMDS